MPYRKRYNNKRRRGFNPLYKAAVPAIGYVAMKAAKLVARKYLNTELKYIEWPHPQAVVTAAGTDLTAITSVAQGLTETTRVGNSIRLKNMQLRMYGFHNSAGSDVQWLRLIVFRDTMQQGVAPTVAQLLEGTSHVLRFLERDQDHRFNILRDKVWTMSVTGQQGFYFKMFREVDTHVKFVGTAANAASNGQGSLYVMLISSEATNGPQVDFNARVRFIDN